MQSLPSLDERKIIWGIAKGKYFYLSLGNLKNIFWYHVLNLKSLVQSSLLKLFYTFIVTLSTNWYKGERESIGKILLWQPIFFKIFHSPLCLPIFSINFVQIIFFLGRRSLWTFFWGFFYENLSNYSFDFLNFAVNFSQHFRRLSGSI